MNAPEKIRLTEFSHGGGCGCKKLAAEVKVEAVPVIAEALDWVKQGVATGASDRNWKGYGAYVELPAGAPRVKIV